MLVRSNFCLLLLPTTHRCLRLLPLIPPLPYQLLPLCSLITILGDGDSCFFSARPISQWCVSVGFCSSQPQGVVCCASCWILHCCSDSPGSTVMRRGPVSQNKGITIRGLNGSTSCAASVIERITVRIDIAGLPCAMDYIPAYVGRNSRFKEAEILWAAVPSSHRQHLGLPASLLRQLSFEPRLPL